MAEGIQVEITGFRPLAKAFADVGKELQDFKPLWKVLRKDFHKKERQRFTVRGSKEAWQDLADSTKRQKKRIVGKIYPILVGSTKELADSLRKRNAPYGVFKTSKLEMEIGTNHPVAIFHHSKKPRHKIPRRPLFDENPKGTLLGGWIDLTDRWVQQSVEKVIKNAAS